MAWPDGSVASARRCGCGPRPACRVSARDRAHGSYQRPESPSREKVALPSPLRPPAKPGCKIPTPKVLPIATSVSYQNRPVRSSRPASADTRKTRPSYLGVVREGKAEKRRYRARTKASPTKRQTIAELRVRALPQDWGGSRKNLAPWFEWMPGDGRPRRRHAASLPNLASRSIAPTTALRATARD